MAREVDWTRRLIGGRIEDRFGHFRSFPVCHVVLGFEAISAGGWLVGRGGSSCRLVGQERRENAGVEDMVGWKPLSTCVF